MDWKVLDTGVNSASRNMEIDQDLLNELQFSQRCVLHFYDWAKDSATYGYFTDPYLYLDMAAVEQLGLQLARRPTGGGITFHLWDLAFSILIPATHPSYSLNTLENYAFINRLVLKVIQRFTGHIFSSELLLNSPLSGNSASSHFCMAKPTQYDLVVAGKKVGGAAQRRTKFGFLHQGTLSLVLPPKDYLEELLLPESGVLESIYAHTFPLIQNYSQQAQVSKAKQELRQILQEAIKII